MPETSSPSIDPVTAQTFGAPTQFGEAFGFLHPAEGRIGAVIVPHWGYEGLCFHPMVRRLAGDIAAAGTPCLRYDPPGSGHSGDIEDEADLFAVWTRSVIDAVAALRGATHARGVILIGFGLGAAALAQAAGDIEDVTGAALIAPWLAGGRALRELSAAGRLAGDAMGLAPGVGAPPGGLSVVGFTLTRAHRDSIARIRILPEQLACTDNTLIVARPEQAVAAGALAEALAPPARLATFEGYDKAAFDPSNFEMPQETVAAIVEWTSGLRACDAPASPARAAPARAVMSGADGLQEEAARFGSRDGLFGVLAAPSQGAPRAAAILINAGRNRAIGWARGDVAEARRLARGGVAALRFDLAGVGDSAPVSADEPLYDARRAIDVSAAIDLIESRFGALPIALRGPCSGAFLGFAAAVADERVKGAALINAQRYVWNPHDDFDTVMRQPVHVVELAREARDPRQIARLMRGEISPLRLTRRLSKKFSREAQAFVGRRGFAVTHDARLVAQGRRGFAELARRGVALTVIISQGDRAIDELKLYFGDEAQFLHAHGPQALAVIRDADHNLTAPEARRAASDVFDAVIARMTPNTA